MSERTQEAEQFGERAARQLNITIIVDRFPCRKSLSSNNLLGCGFCASRHHYRLRLRTWNPARRDTRACVHWRDRRRWRLLLGRSSPEAEPLPRWRRSGLALREGHLGMTQVPRVR